MSWTHFWVLEHIWWVIRLTEESLKTKVNWWCEDFEKFSEWRSDSVLTFAFPSALPETQKFEFGIVEHLICEWMRAILSFFFNLLISFLFFVWNVGRWRKSLSVLEIGEAVEARKYKFLERICLEVGLNEFVSFFPDFEDKVGDLLEDG